MNEPTIQSRLRFAMSVVNKHEDDGTDIAVCKTKDCAEAVAELMRVVEDAADEIDALCKDVRARKALGETLTLALTASQQARATKTREWEEDRRTIECLLRERDALTAELARARAEGERMRETCNLYRQTFHATLVAGFQNGPMACNEEQASVLADSAIARLDAALAPQQPCALCNGTKRCHRADGDSTTTEVDCPKCSTPPPPQGESREA